MIYIVIPVFGRLHFTVACINSIFAQDFKKFKILIVDHSSNNETANYISDNYKKINLIRGSDKLWWTGAINLGVNFAINDSFSNEDFVLILNNDLEVNPDYLTELLRTYNENKPTIVGSTSLDFTDNEKICFIGITWNKYTAKQKVLSITNFKYSDVKKAYNYTESALLQGRGTLIPIYVFKEIGIFDDLNFPHYGADEDFSLRCKAHGFKLLVSVHAIVKSHVNATGINFKYKRQSFTLFLKSLFLINSPINLKIRYRWAKKHTPLPLPYFIIDITRIFFSYLKKALTRNE